MKLSQLIKNIEIKEIKGSDQVEIKGIAFDSRIVKPGDLFVCISGFQTDGHIHAPAAVEKGAAAIIAEKDLSELGISCIIVENSKKAMAEVSSEFYNRPQDKFCLIGITGTNGKTTTTYLVKSVLEAMGKKVGLIGTNQNMIGTEIIPSKHTTPDSLELMRLFAKMVEKGVEYVVMEVSSHSLALDRVSACLFDVGAFTNITQDHLDFHKTMEEYLETKGILFKNSKVGVVNGDDDGAEYLINNSNCEEMLTYGVDYDGDMKASNINLTESGVTFNLACKGKTYDVELDIPGKFSVYNALTALGCLSAAGISLDDAVKFLKVARGVKGRVEVVETGKDYTVIIDYAHTPDGLDNVIQTIRGFAKARVITLFGCGGDRDKTKRPKMGKIASSMSDLSIVTSDNPRTEDPNEILKDVLVGVVEGGGEYVVIPNRFEAIEYALDHAEKDDIILLAGKGHETYQILADRTISFDEREIVGKLLGKSFS